MTGKRVSLACLRSLVEALVDRHPVLEWPWRHDARLRSAYVTVVVCFFAALARGPGSTWISSSDVEALGVRAAFGRARSPSLAGLVPFDPRYVMCHVIRFEMLDRDGDGLIRAADMRTKSYGEASSTESSSSLSQASAGSGSPGSVQHGSAAAVLFDGAPAPRRRWSGRAQGAVATAKQLASGRCGSGSVSGSFGAFLSSSATSSKTPAPLAPAVAASATPAAAAASEGRHRASSVLTSSAVGVDMSAMQPDSGSAHDDGDNDDDDDDAAGSGVELLRQPPARQGDFTECMSDPEDAEEGGADEGGAPAVAAADVTLAINGFPRGPACIIPPFYLDRVMAGAATGGTCSGVSGVFNFEDFVRFSLAQADRMATTSAAYWLDVLDTDSSGVLGRGAVELAPHHVREERARLHPATSVAVKTSLSPAAAVATHGPPARQQAVGAESGLPRLGAVSFAGPRGRSPSLLRRHFHSSGVALPPSLSIPGPEIVPGM
ncbi:hypothetical protein FNF28_07482 [Cafeteria roenbergensis]|uniref:EF-hand domain-containing protein n=1 Tax=Cafeteria roenbergensis TaxID=33653 RepID=A0A5A8C546_CAFRO|nr:hypothetical protein FNF28_07482 [Cafeteria roenbergensis]